MTKFGQKISLGAVGGVILIGIVVFAFNRTPDQTTQPGDMLVRNFVFK